MLRANDFNEVVTVLVQGGATFTGTYKGTEKGVVLIESHRRTIGTIPVDTDALHRIREDAIVAVSR